MTQDQLIQEAAQLLGLTDVTCRRGGGAGGQTIDNMMRARCGKCRQCRVRAWVDAYEELMASTPTSGEKASGET